MKYLFAILFVVIVYVFAWSLCRAAGECVPDIDDVYPYLEDEE